MPKTCLWSLWAAKCVTDVANFPKWPFLGVRGEEGGGDKSLAKTDDLRI
jgi:hypothetical protein